jgi:hypothetical protein
MIIRTTLKTEKPPFELTKDGFNNLVESLNVRSLQATNSQFQPL